MSTVVSVYSGSCIRFSSTQNGGRTKQGYQRGRQKMALTQMSVLLRKPKRVKWIVQVVRNIKTGTRYKGNAPGAFPCVSNNSFKNIVEKHFTEDSNSMENAGRNTQHESE